MIDSDMGSLKENYEEILNNINKAKERSGRSLETVRLMAVTKTRDIDTVLEAYNNGFRLFGENRIQEALEKFNNFKEDAELHIIGQLQSNKVKKAVSVSSCIQSVDRLKIAGMINRYCIEFNKNMDIYLEYNTSGEASKSGFLTEDTLYNAIENIFEMKNITIKGLMTVGPLSANEYDIHQSFSLLRTLRDRVNVRYPESEISELSMGMSGDYEIAVEEGSTLVRVGTSLFGARIY